MGKESKALSLTGHTEFTELIYLHQNMRKICSDETTHPSGKVVYKEHQRLGERKKQC